MKVNSSTVLIVHKDGRFIQTESAVIGGTIWTASAYDALKMRNARKAVRSAQRVGGELWLFSPVTGERRPANMEKILNGIKREENRDEVTE